MKNNITDIALKIIPNFNNIIGILNPSIQANAYDTSEKHPVGFRKVVVLTIVGNKIINVCHKMPCQRLVITVTQRGLDSIFNNILRVCEKSNQAHLDL